MELDSQSVTDPSVDVSLQSIELGSPNARCNAAAQNRPLGPCRFCSKTVLVRFPPCLASSSAAFAGRLQGPVTIVKVKKKACRMQPYMQKSEKSPPRGGRTASEEINQNFVFSINQQQRPYKLVQLIHKGSASPFHMLHT